MGTQSNVAHQSSLDFFTTQLSTSNIGELRDAVNLHKNAPGVSAYKRMTIQSRMKMASALSGITNIKTMTSDLKIIYSPLVMRICLTNHAKLPRRFVKELKGGKTTIQVGPQ